MPKKDTHNHIAKKDTEKKLLCYWTDQQILLFTFHFSTDLWEGAKTDHLTVHDHIKFFCLPFVWVQN